MPAFYSIYIPKVQKEPVTDIRCFLYLPAVFPFKTGTHVVAFVAGPAECVTDKNLATGICLFAAKTVDTEVIRVIKASPVP